MRSTEPQGGRSDTPLSGALGLLWLLPGHLAHGLPSWGEPGTSPWPWALTLLALGALLGAIVLAWILRIRQRDRRSLERSQAKFRFITEGSGDLITEHEVGTGVILYASPAARSLGFEPEEMEGRSIVELVPEEDREQVRADLAGLSEGGDARTMTHRLVSPAGEVRWVEATARRIADRYPTIVAVIRDITERKEQEDEKEDLRRRLQRSAVAWRETFDAMESPIVVVDERGGLRRVNRAAARLAGTSPAALVGRTTAELESPFWRVFEELAEQAVAAGRPARGSYHEGAGPGGGPREAAGAAGGGLSWSVVVHPGISLVAESNWLVGTATDVTHLMELQTRLRRRNALATLGTLFANVAHEVRNPLFSLSGLLEAVQRRFSHVEGLEEYLATLAQEVERLRTIMLGLFEYGRPAPLQRSLQEPSSLAREALGSLEAKAEEASVELELTAGEDLPPISADRVRVVEVLVNVLENAIQHSEEDQRVTLALESRSIDRREQVRFAVRDRGPGFDEQDLERIFEPFYSRRPGGTGLGLPIVQRLVELHGGEVRARNAEGGGAEVEILLPVSPSEPGAEGSLPGSEPGSLRRTQRGPAGSDRRTEEAL